MYIHGSYRKIKTGLSVFGPPCTLVPRTSIKNLRFSCNLDSENTVVSRGRRLCRSAKLVSHDSTDAMGVALTVDHTCHCSVSFSIHYKRTGMNVGEHSGGWNSTQHVVHKIYNFVIIIVYYYYVSCLLWFIEIRPTQKQDVAGIADRVASLQQCELIIDWRKIASAAVTRYWASNLLA